MDNRNSQIETANPIEQLKNTSAMLAVLLEDIYDMAPPSVKDRICEEIERINRCIRQAALGA
ncbi:MAG: hypothetical protein HYU78_02300 [Rhodocyclales bacterium]|nr:hypothetical protein [Rhodocyclales bacterium]